MKSSEHVKRYKVGDIFIDYFDRELKIIGIVETYIVTRYKGAMPTIQSASYISECLKNGKLKIKPDLPPPTIPHRKSKHTGHEQEVQGDQD